MLINIVVSIKSKPQTPKGTKNLNLHEDLLREVNKFLVNQQSDQGKNGSDPLGPPRPP
jgi:hypothetical protein